MKQSYISEYGEHIVVMDRKDRGLLNENEKIMLANMDSIVDEYDEDCPPMPQAMADQMRADIANRKTAIGTLN